MPSILMVVRRYFVNAEMGRELLVNSFLEVLMMSVWLYFMGNR